MHVLIKLSMGVLVIIYASRLLFFDAIIFLIPSSNLLLCVLLNEEQDFKLFLCKEIKISKFTNNLSE